MEYYSIIPYYAYSTCLCFTVPSPPTNTKVFSTDINTTAISWTAPILGVKTCKGEEQFIYTVTVSHLNGSLVTNVTRKNTTVDIRFCMITSVSVFAWNSIGTSEPDVWRNQGRSLDNVQCMYKYTCACMCLHAFKFACIYNMHVICV